MANNKTTYKIRCFFCKYEIYKGRVKIMNYKNTAVKVCSACNSKKFKACALKYRTTFLDCSVCKKAVKNNNCILCSICTHWFHQKCTKLSTKDIKVIERLNVDWTCNNCTINIYPFSVFDYKEIQASSNTQRKPGRTMKSKCFSCTINIIPFKRYKYKIIYYENKQVRLCEECSITDNHNLKDKNLIEYIECTVCYKNVTHDLSLFCNICQHWIHAECTDLTMHEFNLLGEHKNKNDDWYCLPCRINIFPFMDDSSTCEPIVTVKTNEFKTHVDCSVCTLNYFFRCFVVSRK